jgi:hypothetical protein
VPKELIKKKTRNTVESKLKSYTVIYHMKSMFHNQIRKSNVSEYAYPCLYFRSFLMSRPTSKEIISHQALNIVPNEEKILNNPYNEQSSLVCSQDLIICRCELVKSYNNNVLCTRLSLLRVSRLRQWKVSMSSNIELNLENAPT